MASLQIVVVLLASAAAAPRAQDNPTKYSSKSNTREEKKRIAEEGCLHVPQHSICQISCLYKSIRVIDKDGRYMESGAADVMAIFGDNEKINPDAMKEAAIACNYLNKAKAKGCMRALEVTTCLQKEYTKARDSSEVILEVGKAIVDLDKGAFNPFF